MGDRGSSFTVEEIRQRLSISTLVFHGYRPIGEAALEELARHGIGRIELIESPEQYDLTSSSLSPHIQTNVVGPSPAVTSK